MYKTPGARIEEIAKQPASIGEVSTAIPAFIGYTQISNKAEDGTITPVRITSLFDYKQYFGTGNLANLTVYLRNDYDGTGVDGYKAWTSMPQLVNTMYYHLQLYFANGGGPCYIASVGPANGIVQLADLLAGLDKIAAFDEPTLLVIPEVIDVTEGGDTYDIIRAQKALAKAQAVQRELRDILERNRAAAEAALIEAQKTGNYAAYIAADQSYMQAQLNYQRYQGVAKAMAELEAAQSSANAAAKGLLYQAALKQCATLRDRFTIMDCPDNDPEVLRSLIGTENLHYGAAYHPFLETTLSYVYDEDEVWVNVGEEYVRLSVYRDDNPTIYNIARQAIAAISPTLNPSGTIAGVYAATDRTRGVWKAPANIPLSMVKGLTKYVSDEEQADLNIDPVAGKSINAIRRFSGKGYLVWGARTLAGNDNEWRYVSVRRLFIMAEENIKKVTGAFVFGSNDMNTWLAVQSMTENYLTMLWRAGALQGDKPKDAFYVSVGLGKTMTPQDVLEGRMIVGVGLAAVRPAEFIVLRFSHMMAQT